MQGKSLRERSAESAVYAGIDVCKDWLAIHLHPLGRRLRVANSRDGLKRLKRQLSILKALPFYLDVVTLCVESGLNLTSAVSQAIAKAPANPLKVELQRVMRDIRTGRPRLEAFRSLSERLQMPAISNLVSALVTADRQGAALGPILRAQAEQRRSERFLRAEKLAMEAPVKMLFPLIAFIFPCTFAVIAFPIAVKFLEEGFFR